MTTLRNISAILTRMMIFRKARTMDKQIILETCEEICDKFCKFENTGSDGMCVWCQTHENKCPLDKLIKMAEDE